MRVSMTWAAAVGRRFDGRFAGVLFTAGTALPPPLEIDALHYSAEAGVNFFAGGERAGLPDFSGGG